MHIKVDEDIPPIAAAWLQERGYEASTVVDQGMGGWQDDPFLITLARGTIVIADYEVWQTKVLSRKQGIQE